MIGERKETGQQGRRKCFECHTLLKIPKFLSTLRSLSNSVKTQLMTTMLETLIVTIPFVSKNVNESAASTPATAARRLRW